MVEVLLDRGAQADLESGTWRTALQVASLKNQKHVVEILLDKGANVNIESPTHGTALRAASGEGHEQIVEILLNNGAEVNAQIELLSTPFMVASASGHEQVVQVLLDRGADANAQSGFYSTALKLALAQDYERIVDMLFDNGAGVDAQSNYWRELQTASVKGNIRVVKILLDNGAEVNTRSSFYGNALHAAAFHGENEVLQLLISRYDISQLQDPYSRSLLWWAAAGGQASTVRLLMEDHKLDDQIPDKFGRTPLGIAQKKRYSAVLKIFSREDTVTALVQAMLLPDEENWISVRCSVCTLLIVYLGTYYYCSSCSDKDK